MIGEKTIYYLKCDRCGDILVFGNDIHIEDVKKLLVRAEESGWKIMEDRRDWIIKHYCPECARNKSGKYYE